MASKRSKTFKNPTGYFISEQEDAPEENRQPEEQPTHTPAEGGSYSVPTGYRLVRETKSQRLQLLTTPTIAESLRAAAIAQGISLNELCTRIFEDYLKAKATDSSMP